MSSRSNTKSKQCKQVPVLTAKREAEIAYSIHPCSSPATSGSDFNSQKGFGLVYWALHLALHLVEFQAE